MNGGGRGSRRWIRVRLALGRFWVDLGPNLGSWRLSIVLMVLAALYSGLLAVWATSSDAAVVQRIAQLAPFWIVYGLLLVNTTVCLWRRFPTLRRELSSDRRKGLATLGTFLFHGAFLLLASGFLLTLLGRQEASLWLAVGEDFVGREDQFLAHSPPRPLATGVPQLAFRLEGLDPEFWGDQLFFTRYEAVLVFPDRTRRTTRINRPLWLGPATFLRLSGYGFAPRYELTLDNGLRVDTAFVKLNVFPPGLRDSFSVGRFPHRISVAVYPDLADEADGPASSSLALRRPGVDVEVTRGRITLGREVLEPGETLAFEGLRLGFPEVRAWAELTEVWDPGAPLVFAGYIVGLVGLLLKLVVAPRRRQRTHGIEILPGGPPP